MRAAIINSGIVTNVVMLNDLSEIVGAIDGTLANIGDTWDGANFIRPPASPAPIPQTVTMRQARLALHAAGLLSAVQTAINAGSDDVKITWEYSSEVQRNNGLVPTMAASLGMTEAQIDNLFIAAAAL
jgi:hypothetical protein